MYTSFQEPLQGKKNSINLIIGVIALIILIPIIVFIAQKYSNKKISSHGPGSCAILEAKYCNKGKVVEWEISRGKIKVIVFELPKDVPIFAHKNTKIIRGPASAAFTGNDATMRDLANPNETIVQIIGNIGFKEMHASYKDIKNGAEVGRTGNSRIKNLGGTILIMAYKKNPGTGKFVTDDELISKLFGL